ncbi:MliC family protein [Haematobacter massiliensis]|nr:MliC family protein [Haematobacter massiliensis]
MQKILCAATLSLLLPAQGMAAGDTTITLPGVSSTQTKQQYSCANGTTRTVQYVNAGPNSLAIMTIDGEPFILVSVVSGSGVRYTGNRYQWFTKGDEAVFSDTLDDSKPSVACTAG